jgi:hypothetical protein
MANKIYPKWKEALLQNSADSDLDGSGSTGVYVALIDTGTYTYSDAHEFYSSISSAIVGTPVELTSKTFTNGVLDAADSTWATVTGATAEAVVLYRQNAGANTTWRLVAFLDTGITGLPVTPNGGNIDCAWHASGIFSL